jgi:hypothetical protein
MPVDPSIPLAAVAPTPVNPLQVMSQVQAYKGNALQQKILGAQLQSNQAQSDAIRAATGPDGTVDWGKASSGGLADPRMGYNALPYAQATQGLATGQIAQQAAGVGLNNAQLKNMQDHLNWAYQTGSAVANNPNATTEDVFTAIGRAVKGGQITPQIASQAIADLPGPDAPPGSVQRWAANHAAQAAGAAAQLGLALPSVSTVDTGGGIAQVASDKISGAPTVVGSFNKTLSPTDQIARIPTFLNGQPGSVPAASLAPPNLLPPGAGAGGGQPPPIPTLPVSGGMPAGTGQAAPLPSGPLPGGGAAVTPAAAATPAPSFLPSGPPMGVQGSNDGNVATVNAHWGQLSNDAAAANTNIGLAQNIKAYADKAATGQEGSKLAKANGLLSIFGVGAQTDLSTATDLLNKQMSRLSLSSRAAAGGTDAAGALATAANPHGAMTTDAIKEAADQVIGAQQMALAEQQVLQPFKLSNNVPGYQQALSTFNQAADPRIWQFQNMTAQQRVAFKASMSPADQKAFGTKIRTLEGIGAIQ